MGIYGITVINLLVSEKLRNDGNYLFVSLKLWNNGNHLLVSRKLRNLFHILSTTVRNVLLLHRWISSSNLTLLSFQIHLIGCNVVCNDCFPRADHQCKKPTKRSEPSSMELLMKSIDMQWPNIDFRIVFEWAFSNIYEISVIIVNIIIILVC